MKYIILVGDGMGDYPVAELGGKTPLAASQTPNMDWIANNGRMGLVKTLPEGCETGSDTANLSLLGYDPKSVQTRRGPLEAASLGVRLDPGDVAFRCNLVTLFKEDGVLTMGDYSAGHISSEEAKVLVEAIDKRLGSEKFRFYSGLGYRHLMVWKGGSAEVETTPPHDITGKQVQSYLDKMNSQRVLLELMDQSGDVLRDHPVNKARVEQGLSLANSVWFWGQGYAPELVSFEKKTGLKGAIISAVDLLRGIGTYAGLQVIRVPGTTGYFDTDYEAKARYALRAIEDVDLVYVHVEAPDEAGHAGLLDEKIRAIESFDSKVVGNILEGLKGLSEYRIMVTTDHNTPLSLRTHTTEPVPFAISGTGMEPSSGESCGFNEKCAEGRSFFIAEGHHLMGQFLAAHK